MSYIDSFKHSLVGEMFGLPVYRALEDIEGDFRCKCGHLLLGGGSGEHPAMVLEKPAAMVARFIDAELRSLVRSWLCPQTCQCMPTVVTTFFQSKETDNQPLHPSPRCDAFEMDTFITRAG